MARITNRILPTRPHPIVRVGRAYGGGVVREHYPSCPANGSRSKLRGQGPRARNEAA